MKVVLGVGMDAGYFRRKITYRQGNHFMELMLQFGYGMMRYSRDLLKEWGAGTAILSPRDLSPKQLQRLSGDIRKIGADLLVDPQFYLPHADHERLISHPYWPEGFESDHVLSRSDWRQFLDDLARLNSELGCSQMLLPGVFAESVEKLDSWFSQHEAMLAEAQESGILEQRSCVFTLSLGPEVVRHTESCQRIIEWMEDWDIPSVYLVLEHPQGAYFIEDPSWLANAFELTGGLALQQKEVIVGYGNQQLLLMVCAGASAIGSGTWMNVRSFPPEKFRRSNEDEIRKRKTWYYAPMTLSEYSVPYMDMAARQGLLDLMAPNPSQQNKHSLTLFAVSQPTTAAFSEADAFMHYLFVLREQAAALSCGTFDETLQAARSLLDEAGRRVALLTEREIRDQSREFGPDVTAACRSALAALEDGLGPRLRRGWADLKR